MTDRRPNDRSKNRFRKPRDGETGRYTAHETDAHDAEEDQNSEEEESCEEESNLTTAIEKDGPGVLCGIGRCVEGSVAFWVKVVRLVAFFVNIRCCANGPLVAVVSRVLAGSSICAVYSRVCIFSGYNARETVLYDLLIWNAALSPGAHFKSASESSKGETLDGM